MKKLITVFFLSAILLNSNFNSNVYSQTGFNPVIEFCTGTWCQWCPCGHTQLGYILQSMPDAVILAYHGSGNDPWRTYSDEIRPLFGFPGYPSASISRRGGVIGGSSGWGSRASLQSVTIQPGVNINLVNKSYDNATRTLTANVNFTAAMDLTGDYYVNFVLTENNIIYSQTGNGSCTGNTNYIHHWIVKSMLNGHLGELLNSGIWTTGTELTRNVNFVIPLAPQVENINNCDLNIFVYKLGSSIANDYDIQQGIKVSLSGTTGISNSNSIAKDYSLSQNYPNPFNPTTNFSFSIPKDGRVSLKFYDILGNEVDTYLDDYVKAGEYSVEFDGSKLSSGIYFYTLTADGFKQTNKMVLTK